jgi:hypothetical protein
MNITSAQYVKDFRTDENISITVVCDGETISVPLASENRHYAEIIRQVEAGTLVIQEAD